jgi:DHA3 family macrolide efflux protein-like MFS transporter
MVNNWKKNAILFLASQNISLFGSSLVQYAIVWHITLTTQSGVMMTISIICGFLPTFFLSPFAGVWADRYNRKILIILSDSMIAIATLILAVLFFYGYDPLWLLFVMSAIRALGSAIQTPAIGAFLPQLVPVDKLTKVNATNGSIKALVMLVSPMLSGALLTMSNIVTVFLMDFITAALAVLTLLIFLHVPVHAKAKEKQSTSYLSDMYKGFEYIKNRGYIKSFFLFCALFFVLAAPVAFLSSLQVTRKFGSDVWRLTALEITFSVGMMVGGIIMAAWGAFKNKVHSMALAIIVIGAFTFTLGFIADFWSYIIITGLIGITIPVFNTSSTVLLQERVEENYLGRVFGVFGMISSVMMPLGMLVFGPLADIIRIDWIFVGTGLLLFIQGCFLAGNKVMIEAGKPIPGGEGPGEERVD